MTEKEQRLADFCESKGCDGVVLRRRANIAWLTDGADVHCDTSTPLGVAALLWSPRRKTVLCDTIEAPRMAEEEFGREWKVQSWPWPQEPPPLPKGRWATDWPKDVIAPLRWSLTAADVRRYRALGRDAAEVVRSVMENILPGVTEHQIAGITGAMLRQRGIMPYVVLVAADRRVDCYRHPIPTANRLRRKLMVVVCAQRHGLIVSLTRLVHFGKPPAELRRKHQAVCRVDEALHAATKPGARWCDVLAEGVRAYQESGYGDEWLKHHQGGPTGYECRDFKATPREKRRVMHRQAVAWNPSITGTKSEDTTLSDGEVLTVMPGWPLCGTRPDLLVR